MGLKFIFFWRSSIFLASCGIPFLEVNYSLVFLLWRLAKLDAFCLPVLHHPLTVLCEIFLFRNRKSNLSYNNRTFFNCSATQLLRTWLFIMLPYFISTENLHAHFLSMYRKNFYKSIPYFCFHLARLLNLFHYDIK